MVEFIFSEKFIRQFNQKMRGGEYLREQRYMIKELFSCWSMKFYVGIQ